MFLMTLLLATTFEHALSLTELADRSDSVVLGEVTGLHTETRDGLPWTVAELQVTKTLAGPPSPTLEMRWPGGLMAEGVEYSVVGTPALNSGDTVVAFVHEGKPVALAQGVLLYQDPQHLWSPTGLEFQHGALPPFVSLEQVTAAIAE